MNSLFKKGLKNGSGLFFATNRQITYWLLHIRTSPKNCQYLNQKPDPFSDPFSSPAPVGFLMTSDDFRYRELQLMS